MTRPAYQLAPLGLRIFAWVIDHALPMLTALVVIAVLNGSSGGQVSRSAFVVLVVALLVTIGWGVFLWWSGGERGATPGLKAMGLQIISVKDGQPVGWGRYLARLASVSALAATVVGWPLMLIWMTADREHRGWHDMAAGGIVISKPLRQRQLQASVDAAKRPVTRQVPLPSHLRAWAPDEGEEPYIRAEPVQPVAPAHPMMRADATGPVPQAADLGPQATGPMPHATAPGPQMTGPAAQATGPAPQMTGPAPQATGPAPQATEPAPQATATAPQPTGPAPYNGAPPEHATPHWQASASAAGQTGAPQWQGSASAAGQMEAPQWQASAAPAAGPAPHSGESQWRPADAGQTSGPMTGAPVTGAPVTGAPVTGGPVTGAPMTSAPAQSQTGGPTAQTSRPVPGEGQTGWQPLTRADTTSDGPVDTQHAVAGLNQSVASGPASNRAAQLNQAGPPQQTQPSASQPPIPEPGDDDDPDRTSLRPNQPNPATPQVAPPARPRSRMWCLVLPDGREVPLDRAVVLGRKPAQPTGAPVHLVQVEDTTRTLSKSHIRVDADDDSPYVTDLGSTNGSALLTDTGQVKLHGHKPRRIPEGQVVKFGEHQFLVRRQTAGA